MAFYHESPNTQLDHRAQVVGQVQQYIRDHLSERLTLNDVAAVFNFSPNYLSQLLHKTARVVLWSLSLPPASPLRRN